MGDPLRKHHKRPRSAGRVSQETKLPPRVGPAELSRLPLRPGSVGHEEDASLELDFTDKLKALRELIASSKTRRHVREEREKSSGRIVVRRQGSLCEAKEVGEQVQFSVNSFRRPELAGRLQAKTNTDVLAAEMSSVIIDGCREVYPDEMLELDGQQYVPQRPHSAAESYSHLLSRDLEQMSLALERAWSHMSLESGHKRVTFRKDVMGDRDGSRAQSSLGFFHHEVPERDWSAPTRTLNSHTEIKKVSVERTPTDSRAGSDYYSRETVPQDVPAMLLASDIKVRELMKEKEAIYKQFSPREDHADESPPEHDCASSGSTPRPVQTNVQLSDNPSSPRTKARPRSADPVRKPAEKARNSALRISEDEQHGHWTQLLSQKREKNDSRSVPSSPATVQSNLSLEAAQWASPHTYLLQEAARQLQQNNQHQKVQTKGHRQRNHADGNSDDEDGKFVRETLQDDEVAKILQHPRGKKKIIIRRGSVKVVHEAETDSVQVSRKTNSSRHDGKNKPPVQIKTKSSLQPQSSADSDESMPDDPVLTVDKLKSLLRGRRSESRPSSQASTASVSSPAPMKAIHRNRHSVPHSQHASENGSGLASGKSEIGESSVSKSLQRKIIRRPPNAPQAKERGEKSNALLQKSLKTGFEETKLPKEGRARGGGEVHQNKARVHRPSSAPHFSSKLTSSSLSSSAKSLSSISRKEQGATQNNKTWADETRKRGQERSRSSTDLTKIDSQKGTDDARMSVESLRSSVQRLHEEVSRRVGQEAYIVQGLMNHAESLDHNLDRQHVTQQVSDAGQIRRRLSFDEDTPLVQERQKGETRSQGSVPFGKRLGSGRVLGVGAARDGELILKKKVLVGGKAGWEDGTEQASSDLDTVESSFLTSLEQLSNKQATSTPKQVTSQRQRPASSLSSIVGRNVQNDAVPERDSVSNLRLRRPASVGAVPFSTWESWAPGSLSGTDAADYIVSQLGNASMVHLLQRLYTADDATRQAIILKAQYFKHWQNTAHSLRQQRQLYAESLKRAHKFHVSRLQHRCFFYWHGAADEKRKKRMAEGIHRHHMLRKGLQGFHWAILRSKHQIRTLRMKVNTIMTRTAFGKWQAQFESRREERLRTAFRRWREYAYEERIVREKQRDQNEQLVCLTLLVWREAYHRRVKENVADKYLRRTCLQQTWRVWRRFTYSAKEKARRHSLALDLRKRNMRRDTMHIWRVAVCQSQKASQHFRKRRLRRILQAWRQGAQISHVERQRDMASSLEHWRHTTTRHTFLRWYQQLHLCRAVTMANHTLSRKMFSFWHQSWQSNTHRRQQVEAAITRSRLHKTLMTWRRHVLDQRRRQKQAVFLLETCLMRVTISAWRKYTAFKTGFRASLQHHVKVIQGALVSRCFYLWEDALHVRLDERRQQELWSLSCVRKVTAQWRHKCHIRRLHITLEETGPTRDLALLRRMFSQWLAAKGRADEENAEAVASRQILQRCALQRHFQDWRLATQRALTIRPLVLRQQRQLVTWCFDAWHRLIKSRLERVGREKLFQKSQLSRAFARWKRQYQCQQVSRLAHHGLMQRLALGCLQEWRAILHRKHQARLFHAGNLLCNSFRRWRQRVRRQLREKREQQAEQEMSQTLKQRYFSQWWSGVQAQMAADNDSVAQLQQRHHHNRIRHSFSTWRRSLHAHVISRAYQRTTTLRLLRSVLLEWQEAVSQSLHSAVQHFAQQLGLQLQEKEGVAAVVEEEESGSELGHSLEFRDLMQFGDADQFASPCSSSAASLKQLFASDQSATSERMLGVDLDLDRASLLNSGLLEAVEERRQKNMRMQALSVTFITRLRHWPISLAFSQWLDYSLRQRHLRQLAQEVEEKHRVLMVGMAFRQWTVHFANNQKATNLKNWKLQHGTLTALLEYSRHRKVKAILEKRARGHLVQKVLSRIFPWWLAKAQEQRHQRTVLHLWSTATPEEAELLPLEASLTRQIRHRSLRACLHLWRVRFLFLVKLKRVYHVELLGRVLCTWQEWASLRHFQRKRGENFMQARRKNLAFRMWCERLHQKRETERRYQAALEGYLRLVFRCWRDWAQVSRRHRQSGALLEARVNQVRVWTHFVTWRRLTQHGITIRAAHHAHLLHSVLVGWQQATVEGKQLRQTILSFQARSLTHLVGQLFHLWQLRYQWRQQQHQQREERAQHSALRCGRHWRKMAQKTRGRKLVVVFRYNRLSQMFHHWRASLARVEELKQRQGALVVQKNRQAMRRLLTEWRQRLRSAVLLRTFTHRLLVTLLHAWQTFAKGSKERRIRGLALQHALQERNLRVYFLYWRQMSVRVRSLQNNVEVRLQLRVLQAWSYVTRRRCSQRRLGEKFVRLRQDRIMYTAFYTLRTRFDYCQGLREIADSMCAKRDQRTAMWAMQSWKDAGDNIVAQRFYQRLVCVRAARIWLRFVMRVKAERQHEEQQTCKAIAHHNKILCHVVLEALKQEVKVKRQLQRRQQMIAVKFATVWKRIADLSVTAAIMEEERLYTCYWRRWRLAWVRCQAANRDAALHRRQLLSQVFTSWHSLCPSRRCVGSLDASPGRRSAQVLSNDSGRDSPTTRSSYLPVPIASSRRSVYDS